jgi:hypothetical protein
MDFLFLYRNPFTPLLGSNYGSTKSEEEGSIFWLWLYQYCLLVVCIKFSEWFVLVPKFSLIYSHEITSYSIFYSCMNQHYDVINLYSLFILWLSFETTVAQGYLLLPLYNSCSALSLQNSSYPLFLFIYFPWPWKLLSGQNAELRRATTALRLGSVNIYCQHFNTRPQAIVSASSAGVRKVPQAGNSIGATKETPHP